MKKHVFKDYFPELIKMLIPVIAGFILGYFTFHKQYDATEQGKLNQDLNQLLSMNMQYPFVEDTLFIARWDKRIVSSRDSSLKYDAYCIYVFNLIENTAEYFDYDKTKISTFLDVSELITTHKKWWSIPKNNQSYPEKFRQFINEAIVREN